LDKSNYFHRAIHKYGSDNFEIQVIDTAKSGEELDEKEIYWIQKLETLVPFLPVVAGNSRPRQGIIGRKYKAVIKNDNRGVSVGWWV
jgi:hypothetical protein